MWEVSEGRGHSRIEDSLRNISPADRPFRPYSAALVNTLDEMQMLTPDALASGDNITPLQQVRQGILSASSQLLCNNHGQ
jgi:hypothetical protein